MLTADPNVIPNAHRVKVISFTEAAELAYFGAKVLHPATVMPAIDRNIPVMILNSRRPQVEGTRIQSATVPSKNVVKSIACKAQSDGAEHPLHAHVHGARFHAAHLRSLRPQSDFGGHGRDVGGQRLPHHRSARTRGSDPAPNCASSPKSPSTRIKLSSALWVKTSGTLPALRRACSTRSAASMSAWCRRARRH